MTSKSSLTTEIISQAQSYDGIRAGIVRLKDVLKGYSYQAAPDDPGSQGQLGKASDGVEAVEMAVSLRPDVVLMDIQMPELDGLEAARQIQEHCPMPVVILTAHESRSLVEKASEVGVGAYLIKPPNPAEIERAITVAVARFDDMMELRRLNTELKEALAKVKTLSGFLPICANCKKIRDDKGYWTQIEAYIRDHSEAEFSHGICPECAKELYPDIDIYDD